MIIQTNKSREEIIKILLENGFQDNPIGSGYEFKVAERKSVGGYYRLHAFFASDGLKIHFDKPKSGKKHSVIPATPTRHPIAHRKIAEIKEMMIS